MAPDRRCPTLDRPSIDIGVSLEEWNVFTRRWEAFRRSSGISNESASSQLFQCATKILGDNLLQSDAEIVSKPVQELLLAMQRLAVIPVVISVPRSELWAMHQMRGEQFRAFAARVRRKAGTCSFSTDCSCGVNVDYTDHAIRDTLLNGIVDEDIRRDLLGTADILTSPINTVIALVETKEIARNAVPSTDIASVSTFKRSIRATAQGSSLAPAYNLPPTFTNHSTQPHCPRCNQLFSLYKEGPTGWNTKPYSMCLNCYRTRRRPKRRNGHVTGPSLQAVQPSNTVTPHLGVVHSVNASEQEYEPSSLEATNCQDNIASHQVFQEGKWISSPMQGHTEILVNIFIDGATHSGAPAKVARNVTAIADTDAQTNVWSLDAFLQCGFDCNIPIPSADLVAANHTVISIAGAFPRHHRGDYFRPLYNPMPCHGLRQCRHSCALLVATYAT